jgi:AcrR family transcriptional regulator
MKIRVARKPAHAYQHGNLREALVQAGLRLLSDGGVENLSLRGAAQLAGVSHAAPYRHFADKEALVAAIKEEGFKLLAASLEAAEAPVRDRPVRERLRAQGQGYVNFALAHPAYLRVIFGGGLPADRTTADGLRRAGERAYGLLRDLVTDGIASGELRQADPDLVSLAAWSMVHGLSHLLISGSVEPPGGGAAVDGLTDALLALLGEGIAAPARR